MDDEEDVLLPRPQAVLSRTRLRALGPAWEVVRRTAPTHAHPVVARRPPGNVLAAVALSVLDRARDLVDGSRGCLPWTARGAVVRHRREVPWGSGSRFPHDAWSVWGNCG